MPNDTPALSTSEKRILPALDDVIKSNSSIIGVKAVRTLNMAGETSESWGKDHDGGHDCCSAPEQNHAAL